MFLFYQAKLTEKNIHERINNLLDFASTASEGDFIFLSPYFFDSCKAPFSSSSILFEKERNDSMQGLLEKLPSKLILISSEKNSIQIIFEGKASQYSFTQMLHVHGKKIAFYNNPSDFKNNEKADLNVFYNSLPFTINLQKENEELLSKISTETQSACVLLNSVYANEGLLFHGQSFFYDENGTLVKRLKKFEEDSFKAEPNPSSSKVEGLSADKYKDIFEALVFGIKEHVKASGLTKIVMGLSGGIDSALVAPLCVEAVGKENVYGLLMPSPHSSAHSVSDAKLLATNLGIQSYILPLEDAMNAYHALLLPLAKENNASEHNTSLMLQNLQSRQRAVLIMGLSNALPAFVMGTGNKSEECMGYCTLYGDTCAALFPIADLYKEDVYALAHWYNAYKGKEIIPHGSLPKEPSAELAPGQKDSDSLPNYPLLDSFLVEVLENGKDPFKVEHSFTQEERIEIMKKMKVAEFKRQQSAPIIKITNCTLGVEWV